MKNQFKNLYSKLKAKSYPPAGGLKAERGITLIELLVAMTIFTVIITVVTTIFISMASAYKRSASAIDIDNTAYSVLESITKEMRTGRNFEFYGNDLDCSNAGWPNISAFCNAIKFINYKNQTVIYRLNTSAKQIEKKCEDQGSDCYTGGAPNFMQVTPTTIQITDARFNINGQNPNGPDGKQMRITVTLKAETLPGVSENVKREIILQTTVSSREPDS